jgi:hypothetical protein
VETHLPHARYLTSRTEREFWAGHRMEEARAQMFRDSVIPVETAGLLDLIDVPATVSRSFPDSACFPHPAIPPAT